jgi:hypothetical protein
MIALIVFSCSTPQTLLINNNCDPHTRTRSQLWDAASSLAPGKLVPLPRNTWSFRFFSHGDQWRRQKVTVLLKNKYRYVLKNSTGEERTAITLRYHRRRWENSGTLPGALKGQVNRAGTARGAPKPDAVTSSGAHQGDFFFVRYRKFASRVNRTPVGQLWP